MNNIHDLRSSGPPTFYFLTEFFITVCIIQRNLKT